MKQKLLFLGVALMAISMQLSAEFSGDGRGTQEKPYKIRTAEQLNEVRYDLSAHYRLMEDIDLTEFLSPDGDGYNEGLGWKPIGEDFGKSFTGSFDGDNKTIRNLWFNRLEDSYVGLFGVLSTGGEIKKLNIELAGSEDKPGTTGDSYVGGLVGTNSGTITSCHVTGVLTANRYVGGLCGYNDGDIASCSFSGTVASTGMYAGGLLGMNEGAISSCYAAGEVMTDGGNAIIGGLVGSNEESATITKSYTTAAVSAAGANAQVGGLIGRNLGMLEGGCYATGGVIVAGDFSAVGGLIGYTESPVTNCYAGGEVTALGEYVVVGGLIGEAIAPVTHCYAFGGVTSPDETACLGGLVGVKGQDIADPVDCFYLKDGRTNNGIFGIGAIVGMDFTTCTRHFPGVSPLAANEMFHREKFTNWTFSEVWSMREKSSPAFIWQKEATLPVPAAGIPWFESDGSPTNPHLIRNVEDLAALNYYLGDRGKGQLFRLEDNIDLKDWLSADRDHNESSKGWWPIGDAHDGQSCFEGIFDGNGMKITNLWIDNEKYRTGLFGVIGSDGEIKNLGIELAGKGIKGGTYVGILTGVNKGLISSCHATGTVKATEEGSGIAGGLVGSNEGTMSFCYAGGTVIVANASSSIGGLTGLNEGNITSCYTTGEVKGETCQSNCGGLTGTNLGIVTSCYATGGVTVTGEGSFVGGLIGVMPLGITEANNCFYLKEGEINKDLFGVGATLGLSRDISLIPYTDECPGVSPLTVSQMTSRESFTDWDFSTVWTIQEGKTSPYFPWQPEPYPELTGETESVPSVYHTIQLEVGQGIVFQGLSSGVLTVAEGGYLFLQFLPEDPALTAADVLLLIDGEEIAFKDLGAGHYFGHIFFPVKEHHTIEVLLREKETDSTSSMQVSTLNLQVSTAPGELRVESEYPVDIVVYSITGKPVAQLRARSGSTSIALSPGVYIVRIGKETHKVVVNS